MTLKEWASQPGNTLSAVAKSTGLSATYLSNLSNGRKTPSGNTAFAIERATKGVVQAAQWFRQSCENA